jgi:hypothetical protein
VERLPSTTRLGVEQLNDPRRPSDFAFGSFHLGDGVGWMVVLALLTAVPPVFLIVLLYQYFVEVPYLDQWWLLPVIAAQKEGTLSFGLLWHQNAEHRLFVPKVIMVGLAALTNWNLWYEVAVNFLLTAVTFGILAYHVCRFAKLMRVRSALWLMPVVSLVLFSPAPFENWLWSWQMPYYLIAFCVTLLGVVVVRFPNSPASWGIAFLCAMVASFSFATGFAVWLAGMVLSHVIASKSRRTIVSFAWGGGLVLAIALYLVGYEFLSWTDPVSALARGYHFAGYCAVYLGAAVVPTGYIMPAALLGVGKILFFIIFYVWSRNQSLRVRLAVAPFLCLVAFAIGAAAVTAAGRSNIHPLIQAMSPRYITFSQLGWLGVLFLLVAVGRERQRFPILRPVLDLVACLLIIDFLAMSVHGLLGMRWFSSEMRKGKAALICGGTDDQIRKLYVQPAQLRSEFMPLLYKHKLSFARKLKGRSEQESLGQFERRNGDMSTETK